MRNFFAKCIDDFNDEFCGIALCICLFVMFTVGLGSFKTGAYGLGELFTMFNITKGLEIEGFIIGVVLALMLLVFVLIIIKNAIKNIGYGILKLEAKHMHYKSQVLQRNVDDLEQKVDALEQVQTKRK